MVLDIMPSHSQKLRFEQLSLQPVFEIISVKLKQKNINITTTVYISNRDNINNLGSKYPKYNSDTEIWISSSSETQIIVDENQLYSKKKRPTKNQA